MTNPRCVFDSDVAAYSAAIQPWLRRDPVAHNVMSTVIGQRVDGISPIGDADLWIRVLDEDRLAGAALRTAPRELLLPRLPDAVIAALVDAVAARAPDLPGVNGPLRTAERFTTGWCSRMSRTPREIKRVRLYRLSRLHVPPRVPGEVRRATAADQPLVAAWLRAFAAEAAPEQAHLVEEMVDSFTARLARGIPTWLWTVNAEPVSMSAESMPANGIVRIQAVYTPPASRGLGYASACVAAACADLRERVSDVILFADLDNPTSNHIYESIGFRSHLDTVNYAFR